MDIVIYDKDTENNRLVKDICFRYSFRENVEWEIHVFELEEEMAQYMEYSQLMKLIMTGVECMNQELEWERWQDNYIVLMGDSPEELVQSVSPGFRPAGLLLKPVGQELLEQLLSEIQKECQVEKTKTDMFCFKIKGQEYLIAKEKILYFESRNRKIVLRTDMQEIEFYDTLDRLEQEFKESFVRVHKSFLVNFARISMIHFSYRTIHFEDGTFVPFSRTYKESLEKQWERRKKMI